MSKDRFDWYATLFVGELEVCIIPFPSDPSPKPRCVIEMLAPVVLVEELQRAIDDGCTIRADDYELSDVRLTVFENPIEDDELIRFQLHFSVKAPGQTIFKPPMWDFS